MDFIKKARRNVETAACHSNRRLPFILKSAQNSPKFSPPALVGGMRGRVSELAGGEMIDDGAFSACFHIFCFLLFVAFYIGVRRSLL